MPWSGLTGEPLARSGLGVHATYGALLSLICVVNCCGTCRTLTLFAWKSVGIYTMKSVELETREDVWDYVLVSVWNKATTPTKDHIRHHFLDLLGGIINGNICFAIQNEIVEKIDETG